MTDAGPMLTPATAMRAGEAVAAWSELAPPRGGCRLTPLVEAADMYPLLEQRVLAAKTSVWLAFRIFDPNTATRSDEARAQGLEDWTALLRDAVLRKVEVRVLLTDFEPVMADALHAGSWASFHRLRDVIDALEPDVRERLQLIVIQHEGEIGWGWRQLLRVPLRLKMRRMVASLLDGPDADARIAERPGLWRHLAWSDGRATRWRAGPPPRLWPATYHQKFAVIDGTVAVIGGLDLDERRWDDRRHRARADQTWHDVSSLVEGPVVGDAAGHFAQLWNAELPRFEAIVAEWTDGAARQLTLKPLTPATPPPLPSPPDGGAATLQLVRTRSRRSTRLFAFGPVPHVRELKAAYRLLFGQARRLLYVEAQFFRSRAAARWLAEALNANPALEVIILLANAPEEVAFDGDGDNPAHRHGEWLQAKSLARVARAGGDRVGLFTLAKQEPVRASEAEFARHRGSAYGAGLIHIHAKLVIADDAGALLSSANINGRSFEWDTELGVLWREPGDAIAAFRRTLWSQLFGGALPDGAGLADWRRIAAANRAAAPDARQGFVLPYQLARARRFGRRYRFVPDDLV